MVLDLTSLLSGKVDTLDFEYNIDTEGEDSILIPPPRIILQIHIIYKNI